MDSFSFLEVEGPRVYQPEPGYDERCSVCVRCRSRRGCLCRRPAGCKYFEGQVARFIGSKGLWGQATVRLQTVAVFPCGHEPCGEQGHHFEYTVDGALPCLVHSVLFADCRGIGAAGCLAFPCQPQGVAQAHTCPDPLVDTAPPGGAARRVRQYLLFHSRRLDYV